MKLTLSFVALASLVAGVVLLQRRATLPATDAALSGDLVRCEPLTHALILQTDAAEVRFVIADDTLIHEGARAIALAAVCAGGRRRVKVWYRESAGTRTARVVRIPSGASGLDEEAVRATTTAGDRR